MGDRRRRRPVVPRHARPDERHEEGRCGRVQDDPGGAIGAEDRPKFKTNFNAIFTVRNGGVGYGKISTKAQPSWKKAVESVRVQIATGKIKVTAQAPPGVEARLVAAAPNGTSAEGRVSSPPLAVSRTRDDPPPWCRSPGGARPGRVRLGGERGGRGRHHRGPDDANDPRRTGAGGPRRPRHRRRRSRRPLLQLPRQARVSSGRSRSSESRAACSSRGRTPTTSRISRGWRERDTTS